MKRLSKLSALMLIMILFVQMIPVPVSADDIQPMMGEIQLFAGDFAPKGWALCEGQLLPIAQNTALFSILGTQYGGNGVSNFALPDMRGRVPVGVGTGAGLATVVQGESGGLENVTLNSSQLPAHSHTTSLKLDVSGTGTLQSGGVGNASNPASAVLSSGVRNEKVYSTAAASSSVLMKADSVHFSQSVQLSATIQPAGGSQPHNNMAPYTGLHYIIALQGLFPVRDGSNDTSTYTGEIKMFAGNYEPNGWLNCDGRIQSIQQNTALFALLGTYYGGNGTSTYALPDLQGRTPIGWGQGAGLSDREVGEKGGAEQVTLTTAQMPAHTHGIAQSSQTVTINGSVDAAGGTGNTALPTNAVLSRGQKNEKIYSTNAATASMKTGNVALNLSSTNSDLTPATMASGFGSPHENRMPFLGVHFIINPRGSFPPRDGGGQQSYMGMIKMYAFNFAPGGTVLCNGQSMNISEADALFAILGTTFGGDGQVTFNMPDLQGRVPLGVGSGPGLTPRALGEKGGEESHRLTVAEMPSHTHALSTTSTIAGTGTISATTSTGNATQSSNAILAKGFRNERIYSTASPTQTMGNEVVMSILAMLSPKDNQGNAAATGTTSLSGGNQPHENMKPYLGITYAITMYGIFPSQN